jgi:hypothetical protein
VRRGRAWSRGWAIGWVFALGLFCVPVVSAEELESEPRDRWEEDEAARVAEEHYRMATSLYGQGRYREAVEEFDRSLEWIDDPLVHCSRAVPLIRLGDLREAHRSMVNCEDAFPEGSLDRAEVVAQSEAVRVVIEHLRVQAIGVATQAVPVPLTDVAVEEEPEEIGRRRGSTGLLLAGAGGLVVAGGLGGGAAIWDAGSAGLVDEFLRQSEGGEGTSAERHAELQAELEERQMVFRGLVLASAGMAVVGTGLLVAGLVARPRRENSGVALEVDVDGRGALMVGVHLRF